MSNGRLLWFRSTEWLSFHVDGQLFQPDDDGFVAIPENLAAQIRHPSLQYVGRERPKNAVVEAPTEQAAPATLPSPEGELPPTRKSTTGATLDEPNSTQRGGYRGALEAWMAPQSLGTLQRMGPSAISREFEAFCKRARPELVQTLPKRLRSMEPMIERIIAGRKAVASGSTGRENRH